MRSNYPIINVYKKKNIKSEIVTQLLYGEAFKKISSNESWLKIKNDLDNYKGFIKNKNYKSKVKNTHKIFNIYAKLYSKPNLKNKINKKLSFGSRIKVTEKKNNFCKFDNMWVKKNDLKKISYKTKNYFKYAYKLLGTKYKWGGKHFTGVDCSGLVQLFLNFNNKFCPRDAKDQIKFLKKKVKFKSIKKNDLIFWKDHVAVVISKNSLIHAYGPFKKTVRMPMKETINRIYKTANLKVIGIRRIG